MKKKRTSSPSWRASSTFTPKLSTPSLLLAMHRSQDRLQASSILPAISDLQPKIGEGIAALVATFTAALLLSRAVVPVNEAEIIVVGRVAPA
eukprot:scaffold2728_cov126-Pinguiococcus_pyrenoidosus.AAC.2